MLHDAEADGNDDNSVSRRGPGLPELPLVGVHYDSGTCWSFGSVTGGAISYYDNHYIWPTMYECTNHKGTQFNSSNSVVLPTELFSSEAGPRD